MPRITRELSFLFVALVALFLSVNANARTRTLNTDVVVVGTGASGLAASVSAAESGAKVIALEKLPVTGGSSAFAEGMFAVQTDEQKMLFVDYTPEEMFRRAMEVSQGYKVNPSLIMKYIKESTATIAWLKKQGLSFKPTRVMPGEPQVWHLVQEYEGRHLGSALVTRMADRAEELGVKIMLETPGKGLIVKDGVVKGVEAVDKRGNKVIINAGAVIIATGGFPGSKEKIREWTSFDPDVIETFIPLEKTGDGIDMAMEVGGKLVGTGMMVAPLFKDEFFPVANQTWALQWENNLWVNKYGDRFIDETMVYNFVFGGNIIEAQPGSFAWSVFDEQTLELLETKGSRTGAGGFIAPLTKLTEVRKEMEQAVQKGSKRVAIADSIDELANMIGIDPVKLKNTLNGILKY
jgi:fumarate reductase flavoprotein subunit